MTARVLRPAITASTVIAVLVAALAVYAFLTVGTTHADSTYNPVSNVKFCNAMPASFPDPDIAGVPACAENLATGAAADNTNFLTYPSGDLNFSNVVTLAPGTVSINAGTPAAVGTKIGGLHSDTTLGLLNGACSSLVPVNFVFYNVALPDHPLDPRSTGGSPEAGFADANGTGASTNIAFPQPQGTNDRFAFWHVGAQSTGIPADAVTYTGSQASGTNIAIHNYPSYLLDIFDPDWVPGVSDGPAKPLLPKAVYGGISSVTGTAVPLFFAQFSAGGLSTMPAPLGLLTMAMGQPSVSVLNDPSASVASTSSITDFCTPLAITTTLLGTSVTGGNVRATNPGAAATIYTQQYNASLRDLDQDGIENALDTCPTIPDASHDPRNPANPSDTDADGIGNSCDTIVNPGVPDQDGDTFQNRQDNCPLTANVTQAEAEIAVGQADNGPRIDEIGDACDTGSSTFFQNGLMNTVTLSPTIGNGRTMVVTNVTAKCIGPGPDADGDGYCLAQDTGADSIAVRHNAWGSGLATSAMDSDSDGFSDAVETYLGTDAEKSCAQTPVPPATGGLANDEAIDNWPFDFNDDRQAAIGDVSTYSSRFGKNVDVAPAAPRWDLNANGTIDIGDVSKFSSAFGKRCGQGTAGMPGPYVQQ